MWIADVTWQMTEDGYELIDKKAIWYVGPIESCKGDSTAKKVQEDQFSLEKANIELQNKRFDEVHGYLAPFLSGKIGYSDEAQSALKSNFLNNNARDYSNAGSSIRDILIARGGGGDLPTGGGFVRGISGLMGAQADSRSSGLLNLQLQNEQQKLANQFNASSVLSGNAAALSPSISTTASAGSSALHDYIASKSQGFGAAFTGALGGTLGKGLGMVATGGLSGMLGMKNPYQQGA